MFLFPIKVWRCVRHKRITSSEVPFRIKIDSNFIIKGKLGRTSYSKHEI